MSSQPENGKESERERGNCDCISRKNNDLSAKFSGTYKIHDNCTMWAVEGTGLRTTHGLPLQRRDGKPLSKSDPRMIQISFCPFCGNPFRKPSAKSVKSADSSKS